MKNASPADPAPEAAASGTTDPKGAAAPKAAAPQAAPPGEAPTYAQPKARKGGARPGAGRPPGGGARPASGQPGASGGHADASASEGARDWSGSGPKARRKGATAAELDRWAQQVFTWHAMLGRLIAPELALAPEEAKALAETGANLMAEFDVELGGKAGALIAAGVTAGAIYVPRYLALMGRLEAMRRQAEAQRQGQQPAPPHGPVINPDGTPAGGDAAARAANGAAGAPGAGFDLGPDNPLGGQPRAQ